MVRFFKAKARGLAGARVVGNVTREQSFTGKFRAAGTPIATYRRYDSKTAAAAWSDRERSRADKTLRDSAEREAAL